MVQKHHVVGLENFLKLAAELETTVPKQQINILFSGSKTSAGVSWCSDCVESEPFITKALEKADADSHWVYVEVGERNFWKDPKCPFRTHKDIHISVLPTIIRWKEPQRLEGEQCENDDLLEMFFTDSD